MTAAVADENSYMLLDSIAQNKFPFFTRVKYHEKENSLINKLLTTQVDFGEEYGTSTYENARKKLQAEINNQDKDEKARSEQTKGMVSVDAVKKAVNKAVQDKSYEVKSAMSDNLPSNDATTQVVETALETAVRRAVDAATATKGEVEKIDEENITMEEAKNIVREAVKTAVKQQVDVDIDDKLLTGDIDETVRTALETAVRRAVDAATATKGEVEKIDEENITMEEAENILRDEFRKYLKGAKVSSDVVDDEIHKLGEATRKAGNQRIRDMVEFVIYSVDDRVETKMQNNVNEANDAAEAMEMENVRLKQQLKNDNAAREEVLKKMSDAQITPSPSWAQDASARGGGVGSKKNVSKKRRNTRKTLM